MCIPIGMCGGGCTTHSTDLSSEAMILSKIDMSDEALAGKRLFETPALMITSVVTHTP